MRRLSLALPSVALAIALLAPRAAEACVFYPDYGPLDGGTETVSKLADHRMAIAISPSMTTVWDQVEFVGDPGEFVWVMPVRGPAAVGVGSDGFLTALDKGTSPILSAPKAYCQYNYGYEDDYRSNRGCGCGGTYDYDSAGGSGSGSIDGGVEDGVKFSSRTTAGPYEVVQVHSDDPDAIVRWLSKNKYAVPTGIAPTLLKYTSEGWDFVVVRLRPGAGVKAMRPIRVSTRGVNLALPLRMLAAGAGATVGLKLFVIAEGRFRAKNYPSYAIDPGQIVWDYAAEKSNYVELRLAGAKAFDGRAFAVESSVELPQVAFPPAEPFTDPLPDAGPPDTAPADTAPADTGAADTAASDAVAETTPDAAGDADETGEAAVSATDTAPPPSDTGTPPAVSPTATDVEIAFGTFSYRRITRLRAELPVRHLTADLELEVDPNPSVLGTAIEASSFTNGASVCPGGTVQLYGAGAPATLLGPAKAGAACAMPARTAPEWAVPLGLCVGLVGLGLARRRRR